MSSVLSQWECDLIAIEDAYAPNVRSAAQLQKVVALAEVVAFAAGVLLRKVGPMSVKAAVSYGGQFPQDKKAIIDTVNMLFHLELTKDEDDIADSIAIAMAGEAAVRLQKVML